jgi:hypothetical protein
VSGGGGMAGAKDWAGAVSPAKLTTERDALVIDRVWRPSAWVIFKACRVRKM